MYIAGVVPRPFYFAAFEIKSKQKAWYPRGYRSEYAHVCGLF